MRFRNALFGEHQAPVDAVAETMDTAGKAVLFSGVTVLISLSAVMLVPSPAFRSVALESSSRAVRAGGDADPAAGGVGQARSASRPPRPALGAQRRAPLGSLRALGRAALAPPLRCSAASRSRLVVLALPILGLRTGMPSIKVVPEEDPSRVGYQQVSSAFGPGAPGALQVIAPTAEGAAALAALRADRGIAAALPAQSGAAGVALIEAFPTAGPSTEALGATVQRLRRELPPDALLGGPAVENHDLEAALSAKDPTGHRPGPGTRLPAPPGRLPGAPGGGDRRARQPALHRRRLRRRQADLPGRQPRRPARLRIAGLPRRLGDRSSSSP